MIWSYIVYSISIDKIFYSLTGFTDNQYPFNTDIELNFKKLLVLVLFLRVTRTKYRIIQKINVSWVVDFNFNLNQTDWFRALI